MKSMIEFLQLRSKCYGSCERS